MVHLDPFLNTAESMKVYIYHRVIKSILTLVCAFATVAPVLGAEVIQVNMVYVSGAGDEFDMHRHGAELGVAEGNIQGRFLGINYQLEELTAEQGLVVDFAALPSAVVVAGDEALLRQLQSVYAPLDVAVINIALADDHLRQACLEDVFHTPPSARMLADAEAQWRQQNPGAQVQAMAWHPEFVKFAGRDLNRRFSEQFGVPMNSDAWAGWAATRGLAEAVVRTMSNDPAVITAYLRDSLAFDGQKGVAQSYRVTGQMRQPLLITENGNLLGEAPVRGVARDTELDTLGFTECQ